MKSEAEEQARLKAEEEDQIAEEVRLKAEEHKCAQLEVDRRFSSPLK